MRKRIYMILFFCALLLVIFQYANNKRYYKDQKKEMIGLKTMNDSLILENKSLKASKDTLAFKLADLTGYSLKTNNKARNFFAVQGLNVDSLARQIQSAVISKNTINKDNPLVPYHGIDGVTRIGGMLILNNRWILAKFSDGTNSGEAILSYYLDKDNKLHFDTLDGIIYAQ